MKSFWRSLRFGFCVALSASPLAFSARAELVVTGKITEDREIAIRFAYKVASDTARTCKFLARMAPWLQARMIDAFEDNKIQINVRARDPDEEDECAFSRPSWLSSTHKMVIHPLAFHPVCRGLASVIFHEMVHMTWTYVAEPGKFGWGSEEAVQALEGLCLPEAPREFQHLATQP